jgi:hypothetical protein
MRKMTKLVYAVELTTASLDGFKSQGQAEDFIKAAKSAVAKAYLRTLGLSKENRPAELTVFGAEVVGIAELPEDAPEGTEPMSICMSEINNIVKIGKAKKTADSVTGAENGSGNAQDTGVEVPVTDNPTPQTGTAAPSKPGMRVGGKGK